MPIPDKGRDVDAVISDLQAKRANDVRWQDGRAFGMVYNGGPEAHEAAERAAALDAALRAEGLAGCAYDGGFFVTLDGGADPFATCERLQQHDVFVVPMPEGLRVGICAMKASDAPRFAAAYRASR